ncbi:fibronectin type III domain-containing protein [Ditylenchus destructor]|uniref:Fibronectin type III domain-containing protein n=1 Tax=Ditylenchus destructor TaxID=166010 RepID=A0AAD4RC42_9BILA|nr:fibronectin type III domain-containing protein [Ditylenchus destructor]
MVSANRFILFLVFFIIPHIISPIASRRLSTRNTSTQNVHSLRATYDSLLDAIFVEWEPPAYSQGDTYLVRYKITARENTYGGMDRNWRIVRASDGSNRVKLDVTGLRNSDELLVQVKPDTQLVTEWSDPMVISIAKRVQIGEIVVDEADILPPLNFTANVLDPQTVRLDWSPSPSTEYLSISQAAALYYVLNVKQLSYNTEASTMQQEIKVEANNFVLGNLLPGERYEITIRTASGPDHVSSTAAIVEISTPREDEYFEIGNLIISSRFKADGSGVVNLSWDVPPSMVGKILSYTVQYAPTRNRFGDWKEIVFPGDNPSSVVSLYDLQSDTEYGLKITTRLQTGVHTESGEFRFRTPKVPENPLSKLDVIYSSESNAVRLQWTLASYISPNQIAGYDVYVNENKDEPIDRWRHIQLNTREAVASIDGLQSSTTYFAKVNVRNLDETVHEAPSIYRFTTLDQIPVSQIAESRHPRSLAYRNVSPGRVVISWSYPTAVIDSVAGATIFYTDNERDSIELWNLVRVDNTAQKSAVLIGLQPDTVYYVRVVPVLYDGSLDWESMEKFELRTDE